jgi:hypothetical protein
MNAADDFLQMEIFDDLIESFDVDRDLSLKFFLVFAWFENILKYLGYYNPRRRYVSIDWIRFGDDFDTEFHANKSLHLQNAVNYLIEHAPKNQRITDGHIGWEEVDPEGTTEFGKLLSRVTTVRNNFFHGGKFPRFRERDAQLITACLIVLKECVELHPELKSYYRWQLEGVSG